MTTDSKSNDRMDHDDDVERDDAVIGRALVMSLVVVLIVGGIGAVVYFVLNRKVKQENVVSKAKEVKGRDPETVKAPNVVFKDVTKQAGIQFKHTTGAYGDKLLPETMGSGCAFFDYDNDGDQDILLANCDYWPWDPSSPSKKNRPTMALYANDGSGNFKDVTKQAGLAVSFYGMGIAIGDYDNDGYRDIFMSAVGHNFLFRNDKGRFHNVTEAAGVAGAKDSWSTSCGWFDYNNDGRLDLIVCNYVQWSREIDKLQDFRLVGVGRAYGPPTAFRGTYPYLYRNDGDGKFSDVTKEAGLQVDSRSSGQPLSKGMGVLPIDIDGDGHMEIIIANDTSQNMLFRNTKDGKFKEFARLAGIAFDQRGRARGAMGIDGGFFRNNSMLGIAIGNFSNEPSALYVARKRQLRFVDSANSSGLGPESSLDLTFGLFFFDYDLDGRLDVFGANGHLEEEINKVLNSQHYKQSPHLFWNAGVNKKTEMLRVPAEQLGDDFTRPMVGRGAAFADIDQDGDLDILLTASGGTPRLLRNDQQLGHHWLRVKLVGNKCNRDAIGSWVEIHLGRKSRRLHVMPTRSYLSQVELPVTFGLGKRTKVAKMVIHWADGSKQEIKEPQIDRLHVIEQQ